MNYPAQTETTEYTGDMAERVSAYESAVKRLPQAKGEGCEPREVMAALLARDEIARALERGEPVPDGPRQLLSDADAELKRRSTFIDDCVGSATLAGWRDTFHPASSAWWWALEGRAAASAQRGSLVWAVMTTFAVALALGLTADISRRFLSGGPDKVGLFSMSAQIFLALLAGGTFTQAGRQWLDDAFDAFKVGKKRRPLASFLVTVAVLLACVGFWLSLPLFSDYYNERGLTQLRDEKLTHAVESFERAASLDPNSARALYHLANSREMLLDYDKALAEYQRAVDADPNFKEGLNNLAHLYMLHRSNYQKALDLLSRVFQTPLQSRETEYAAYKNRGWAFLGLKQYGLAEADLRRAIGISDQAEANCMLGQALDALGKPDDGIEYWARCVELAKDEKQKIEPRWLAEAITALGK
jgi:hypothetical protein